MTGRWVLEIGSGVLRAMGACWMMFVLPVGLCGAEPEPTSIRVMAEAMRMKEEGREM